MNFKIKKNVFEEKMDDAVILIIEEDGVLNIENTILLDNVAFDIWNLLKKNSNIKLDKIVEEISKNYDCEKKILRKDTLSFLKELEMAGILKINDKD